MRSDTSPESHYHIGVWEALLRNERQRKREKVTLLNIRWPAADDKWPLSAGRDVTELNCIKLFAQRQNISILDKWQNCGVYLTFQKLIMGGGVVQCVGVAGRWDRGGG